MVGLGLGLGVGLGLGLGFAPRVLGLGFAPRVLGLRLGFAPPVHCTPLQNNTDFPEHDRFLDS